MMDILKINSYKLICLFFFITHTSFAQKYFTRTGFTEFKASIDAFEPVEAINRSTSVILNKEGEIAAQLFISTFNFKVALMQEHFNENYMDSDMFPKAIFKGNIEGFDTTLIKKSYNLSGDLTIKGITKKIVTEITISKTNDHKIVLKGTLVVSPSDFDIKIPSIVNKKIADKVTIILNYELSEKK